MKPGELRLIAGRAVDIATSAQESEYESVFVNRDREVVAGCAEKLAISS